jgi:hypothetical protein
MSTRSIRQRFEGIRVVRGGEKEVKLSTTSFGNKIQCMIENLTLNNLHFSFACVMRMAQEPRP